MDPAEPPEFLHRRDLDKLNAGVAALLDAVSYTHLTLPTKLEV